MPSRIRRKLGPQPEDSLEARVEGQHIVLTPPKVRPRKARIIEDPVTGLLVLTAGPKALKLTSAEVRENPCRFSMRYLLDVKLCLRSSYWSMSFMCGLQVGWSALAQAAFRNWQHGRSPNWALCVC